jgi:hypothetical protein
MDQEIDESSQYEQKKLDKELIKHCNKLLQIAKNAHPSKRFEKYRKYRNGDFEKTGESRDIASTFNLIKPITETKIAFVLDSQILTNVVPQINSFAQLSTIETINDIASIQNDLLKHVQRVNKQEEVIERVARHADWYGSGIAKITWDQDASKGMGDVLIEIISPENFFPDPSATEIKDCNYIFIKCSYSIMTLKQKYQHLIKDIDELVKNGSQGQNDSGLLSEKSKPDSKKGVLNVKGDNGNIQSMYAVDTSGIEKLDKNILVWECYLKDDSTFIKSEDDSNEELRIKDQLEFKYPYGRVVIFAGDDLILEDKPVDYPFGYPFSKLTWIPDDSFWGQGDVGDLIDIQDRLNLAYYRLRTLIAKYISVIVTDALSGINVDTQLINDFVVVLEQGSYPAKMPQVLTNNTLGEIENMIRYITMLKDDAKQIARVNDSMMSGERPTGVNSGKMLDSLNESPMTSIREIQKNLKYFLIDLSNKCLVLIGLYYNIPRITRIEQSDQWIELPATEEGKESNINIYGNTTDPQGNKVFGLVKKIKGDLSICEFETRIEAGAELPRSKQALAQLTMQLAQQGILGDMNSIDTKELILASLDYPGYRAIIQKQRDALEKQQQEPPITPGSLVEKITLSGKDLTPNALQYLETQLGVPAPQPPMPMQPMLPQAPIIQ